MTTPGKPADPPDRRQRLGQALRENLKRRKAQARGRRDGEAPGDEADAAGEGGDTRLSPQSQPD